MKAIGVCLVAAACCSVAPATCVPVSMAPAAKRVYKAITDVGNSLNEYISGTPERETEFTDVFLEWSHGFEEELCAGQLPGTSISNAVTIDSSDDFAMKFFLAESRVLPVVDDYLLFCGFRLVWLRSHPDRCSSVTS